MSQDQIIFLFLFLTAKHLMKHGNQQKLILPRPEQMHLNQSSGKYVLADGYNGTVFLAWKDNRIVVISGLSKDQADIADQYTSEILK